MVVTRELITSSDLTNFHGHTIPWGIIDTCYTIALGVFVPHMPLVGSVGSTNPPLNCEYHPITDLDRVCLLVNSE
jgi:hypothetical protein